jgi:hypothetical protein
VELTSDGGLGVRIFAGLRQCDVRELIDRHRFRSHGEARLAVFQFFEGFYNPSFRPSNTKGNMIA